MQFKVNFKCSTFVIILNMVSDILINIKLQVRMLGFPVMIHQCKCFLIVDGNFKYNEYITCDNVEYKRVIILILLQHVIENSSKIVMKSLEFVLLSSLLCFTLQRARTSHYLYLKYKLFEYFATHASQKCLKII